MSDQNSGGRESASTVGTRGPEAAVAALLAGIGIAVIVDSLRAGIGWADDGPRSGYFPFGIGILLTCASSSILLMQLWRWSSDRRVFARTSQLSGVIAVLVPMVIYVSAIPYAGLYMASIVLIGYFMRRHGQYAWWLAGAVPIGVMLVLFLVFERWFIVPLPKGPIEQWLGF